MDSKSVQTVLCVPGVWKDQDELAAKISSLSGGYSFSGSSLFDAEGRSFELDVRQRDDRMQDAFLCGGPHWTDTPEMGRIRDHAMVAYIVGEGGSRKQAQEFMEAAKALLFAGGLGVKVESSGLSHSPTDWIRLTDGFFSEYKAFVLILTGDECLSCGMHNLGFREGVAKLEDQKEALNIVREFTHYLFAEQPVLRAGHTFSLGKGKPRYRLSEEDYTFYGANSLFHNPFGQWRLTPI